MLKLCFLFVLFGISVIVWLGCIIIVWVVVLCVKRRFRVMVEVSVVYLCMG